MIWFNVTCMQTNQVFEVMNQPKTATMIITLSSLQINIEHEVIIVCGPNMPPLGSSMMSWKLSDALTQICLIVFVNGLDLWWFCQIDFFKSNAWCADECGNELSIGAHFVVCSCCVHHATVMRCVPLAALIPKFPLHQESLKEISPELKHIFVKFRLETGHHQIHRKQQKASHRFPNVCNEMRGVNYRQLVSKAVHVPRLSYPVSCKIITTGYNKWTKIATKISTSLLSELTPTVST